MTCLLVQVVTDAIPAATRATGGHPAKRTFQALRIEVNRELDALAGLVPAALDALAPGGRVGVEADHTRVVRPVQPAGAPAPTDTAPRGLPVVPAEHRARFRLLTRGAERPEPAEEADNPRAASARLRATERLEAA